MKAFFFGFAVAILVSGCASGPQFHQANAAPNGKAAVYIYRSRQIMGWGGLIPTSSPYAIYLNGTNCVELHPGGYCIYYVPSGINYFSSKLHPPPWPLIGLTLKPFFSEDDLLHTNFEAAETYYLKFEVGAASSKLRMMDSQTGEQEIQNCKLEVPKD